MSGNWKMRVSAVLCLALVFSVNAEIWRMERQTSEWDFQKVRRPLDSSVIVDTETSKSLIGCAAFCSNLVNIVVPSLYFIEETGDCHCNSGTDETAEDGSQPEIVYGTRETMEQIEHTEVTFKRTTVWPYQPDCVSLYDSSYQQDGIYMIFPPDGYLTSTWCDMANGGWTVIQRRMHGSENFYRGWNDYVTGFGSRTGEYWLGLETIHYLTSSASELSIYMEGYPGVTPPSMTANYSHFTIGDSALKYKLDISGFSGTCGDSLTYHNGRSFTTFDNDNDLRLDNCAVLYKGGWWYNNCHSANPNGIYYQEGKYSPQSANGIHWYECWHYKHSSKFAIMKIRKQSSTL